MSSSIDDFLADIRIDPTAVGRSLAYSPNAIQERAFQMTLGFIRELSLQHQNGGYVNDNMELAILANDIHYLLTDNKLV